MTAAGGDHGCWASVQGSDPTSWRDLPFNDESQELEFPRCVCCVGMERELIWIEVTVRGADGGGAPFPFLGHAFSRRGKVFT